MYIVWIGRILTVTQRHITLLLSSVPASALQKRDSSSRNVEVGRRYSIVRGGSSSSVDESRSAVGAGSSWWTQNNSRKLNNTGENIRFIVNKKSFQNFNSMCWIILSEYKIIIAFSNIDQYMARMVKLFSKEDKLHLFYIVKSWLIWRGDKG